MVNRGVGALQGDGYNFEKRRTGFGIFWDFWDFLGFMGFFGIFKILKDFQNFLLWIF